MAPLATLGFPDLKLVSSQVLIVSLTMSVCTAPTERGSHYCRDLVASQELMGRTVKGDPGASKENLVMMATLDTQ